MTQWPHDDPQSRAAFYGDPALNQVEPQLVWVSPPFKMYYEGKPVERFRFHKKAAPALERVLADIWQQCGHDQKKVDAAGASDFCGTYNHRKIRGRENERDAWSSHAYGAAIDINAKGNALGNPHGNMPAFVVGAFDKEGFRWGGRYHGRKDFMHFEGVAAGVIKPVGIMSDEADYESEPDVPVPQAEGDGVDTAETPPPWYRRLWSWVSGGGIASLGLGGGSWIAGIDHFTIALLVGAALFVFCVVWFTQRGKGW